jgi:hypothetical protein
MSAARPNGAIAVSEMLSRLVQIKKRREVPS